MLRDALATLGGTETWGYEERWWLPAYGRRYELYIIPAAALAHAA